MMRCLLRDSFLHPLPPSEDIARIQTPRACTNGTRRHKHIHTNIIEVCILHKKWRPVFVSKKPHSSVFDTNGLDWAFLENADARTVELHLLTRSLAPIFWAPIVPTNTPRTQYWVETYLNLRCCCISTCAKGPIVQCSCALPIVGGGLHISSVHKYLKFTVCVCERGQQ